MLIRSIAFRAPSKRITNDDLISLIRERNASAPRELVDEYCRSVAKSLENAGSETRFFRDRAAGERAFDITMDAVRAAMSEANITPSDLDLIIFCGVGRGFVEPANALFVAKALGATCTAFDVSDACMSWVRSLHVAYNFLASKTYSAILVVNSEFNVFERGLPGALDIRSKDETRYSFPALTVGEGASATILQRSDNKWDFRFRSAPQFAGLCTIPLPGYQEFCDTSDASIFEGPHRMTAFGRELSYRAVRAMLAFMRDSHNDVGEVDLWFPHVTAEPIFESLAGKMAIRANTYLGVFRRYGNLVSASIPAAIYLAAKEGRLNRGNRIAFCPATAGMSFAIVNGRY